MFPFLDLPELVQCEVMKRLPAFYKAHTLSPMPEFGDLLDLKMSWNHSSAEFFELMSVIRRLKRGFYFLDRAWHMHGFFVSVGDETASFSVFTPTFYRAFGKYVRGIREVEFAEPVSKLVGFLRVFLENYEPYDVPVDMRSYDVPGFGRFHVNFKIGSLLWKDGTRVDSDLLQAGHRVDFIDQRRKPVSLRLTDKGRSAEVIENDVSYEFRSMDPVVFPCDRKIGGFCGGYTLKFRLVRNDRFVSTEIDEWYPNAWIYLECDLLKKFRSLPPADDEFEFEGVSPIRAPNGRLGL